MQGGYVDGKKKGGGTSNLTRARVSSETLSGNSKSMRGGVRDIVATSKRTSDMTRPRGGVRLSSLEFLKNDQKYKLKMKWRRGGGTLSSDAWHF
jgi:hypothetical protein